MVPSSPMHLLGGLGNMHGFLDFTSHVLQIWHGSCQYFTSLEPLIGLAWEKGPMSSGALHSSIPASPIFYMPLYSSRLSGKRVVEIASGNTGYAHTILSTTLLVTQKKSVGGDVRGTRAEKGVD